VEEFGDTLEGRYKDLSKSVHKDRMNNMYDTEQSKWRGVDKFALSDARNRGGNYS
jgi:hypothetical protein